ncbi:MAG: hypothetical protein ACRDL5_00400 [Solirubrobacteraceae bacterium]
MRRIVPIVTALCAAALILAGAAFASGHASRRHATSSTAINTYSTSIKFTTKAAGTAKKPVAIGYTQDIKAAGTQGNRTAVLLDLKTRIYGLVSNLKDFPTCSAAKIVAATDDTVCPKGAEVATGGITAVLGSEQNFQAAGSPCTPLLHVWNSGPGKLTFFFVDQGSHQCIGLHTGQVGPYPATLKQQGKYMLLDVPIPTYVDFPVAGVAGSLMTEHLVWRKATTKVHGKTVPLFGSVACTGKTRPYSQSFKATLPSSTGGAATTQSATLSKKAAC